MKKILIKIIYICLIVLNVLLCAYILKYYYDMYISKKQHNLLNSVSVYKHLPFYEINPRLVTKYMPSKENIMTEENIIEEKTERMLQLEQLQNENSDIVAWIEIENTDINFPVLQYSDNKYYLKHNYLKKWSGNGSIFLDKDYVWNPPSSNLLIYGHNNKNNTMFQSLLNYRDIEFYEEHPFIKFTTNDEDSIYEIIAVFNSKVYYNTEENVFRYYYFINAENEYEYNEFIENVKNEALYDTGKTAKYGEQLMTLSTCSYHTKDGRFVVVAKKST